MRHYFLIVALGEIFYGIVSGQDLYNVGQNPNGGNSPQNFPEQNENGPSFQQNFLPNGPQPQRSNEFGSPRNTNLQQQQSSNYQHTSISNSNTGLFDDVTFPSRQRDSIEKHLPSHSQDDSSSFNSNGQQKQSSNYQYTSGYNSNTGSYGETALLSQQLESNEQHLPSQSQSNSWQRNDSFQPNFKSNVLQQNSSQAADISNYLQNDMDKSTLYGEIETAESKRRRKRQVSSFPSPKRRNKSDDMIDNPSMNRKTRTETTGSSSEEDEAEISSSKGETESKAADTQISDESSNKDNDEIPPDIPNDYPGYSYPPNFFPDMMEGLEYSTPPADYQITLADEADRSVSPGRNSVQQPRRKTDRSEKDGGPNPSRKPKRKKKRRKRPPGSPSRSPRRRRRRKHRTSTSDNPTTNRETETSAPFSGKDESDISNTDDQGNSSTETLPNASEKQEADESSDTDNYQIPPDVPNDYPGYSYPSNFFEDMEGALQYSTTPADYPITSDEEDSWTTESEFPKEAEETDNSDSWLTETTDPEFSERTEELDNSDSWATETTDPESSEDTQETDNFDSWITETTEPELSEEKKDSDTSEPELSEEKKDSDTSEPELSEEKKDSDDLDSDTSEPDISEEKQDSDDFDSETSEPELSKEKQDSDSFDSGTAEPQVSEETKDSGNLRRRANPQRQTGDFDLDDALKHIRERHHLTPPHHKNYARNPRNKNFRRKGFQKDNGKISNGSNDYTGTNRSRSPEQVETVQDPDSDSSEENKSEETEQEQPGHQKKFKNADGDYQDYQRRRPFQDSDDPSTHRSHHKRFYPDSRFTKGTDTRIIHRRPQGHRHHSPKHRFRQQRPWETEKWRNRFRPHYIRRPPKPPPPKSSESLSTDYDDKQQEPPQGTSDETSSESSAQEENSNLPQQTISQNRDDSQQQSEEVEPEQKPAQSKKYSDVNAFSSEESESNQNPSDISSNEQQKGDRIDRNSSTNRLYGDKTRRHPRGRRRRKHRRKRGKKFANASTEASNSFETPPTGIPNDYPGFSYPSNFFEDLLAGLSDPSTTKYDEDVTETQEDEEDSQIENPEVTTQTEDYAANQEESETETQTASNDEYSKETEEDEEDTQTESDEVTTQTEDDTTTQTTTNDDDMESEEDEEDSETEYADTITQTDYSTTQQVSETETQTATNEGSSTTLSSDFEKLPPNKVNNYTTIEPPPGVKCYQNESYYACVPHCQHTCFNYESDEKCPDFCEPGCGCQKGLLIDEKGRCVLPEDCFELSCDLDEEWWDCKPTCHNTCENFARSEACEDILCEAGCFCRDGLLKDTDGSCVEPDECADPKCEDHEEETDCMTPCNTCVANCHTCPFSMCRRGCECLDGFKRNSTGECIHASLCPPCTWPTSTLEPSPSG